MKLLIAFILVSFFIMSFAGKNNSGDVALLINDTVPKKQYQYILVLRITPYEWQSSMDTLGLVAEKIGIDMLGSQSELYKQAYARQLNRFLSRMTLDSVEIKK